ncbi:energy transducer TonB [Lewinella sp. 4G2]|uniref:energy transducer TonB n=1 Tax=Lewinella sp. 4G2 TaxID=1803372 RepID=UPI0007B4A092|nr:energy transducer TonB [Lewinella sp. 4G2]OAV42798.1 hypothetical protein A3850_016320 [Lewinella sp. 4G2]
MKSTLPLIFLFILNTCWAPLLGQSSEMLSCNCQVDTLGEVFKVVTEMPTFPVSEEENDLPYFERKKIADKALLKYTYQDLAYPKAARDGGFQGMAILSFIVEKDGCLSSFKVTRNPGGQFEHEMLRIGRQMMADGHRWTPGLMDGEAVRVQWSLPIKFKLESGKFSPKVPPPYTLPEPIEYRRSGEQINFHPTCHECEKIAKGSTITDLKADLGMTGEELFLTFSSTEAAAVTIELYDEEMNFLDLAQANTKAGVNGISIDVADYQPRWFHYELLSEDDELLYSGRVFRL